MATNIEQITIKAPSFLETAASAWFAILEAQFHLRNITSQETRFYHALSALPPEVVTRISGDILSSKIYDTLKEQIHEQTKPELSAQHGDKH